VSLSLSFHLSAHLCRGCFRFKGKLGKFRQWTLKSSSHGKQQPSEDFLSTMMQFIEMKRLEGTTLAPEDTPVAMTSKDLSEITHIPQSKKAKFSTTCEEDQATPPLSTAEKDQKELHTSVSMTSTIPKPVPSQTTRADLIALSMRGRDVGREGMWDDDNGNEKFTDPAATSAASATRIVSEETLQMISKTEKQLRRREQKEQQKKRLSDWDQLLDSGRQKKIKTGRPNSLDTYLKQENNGINQFQEYQNFVQDKRAHGEYEDYRTLPLEKKKSHITSPSGPASGRASGGATSGGPGYGEEDNSYDSDHERGEGEDGDGDEYAADEYDGIHKQKFLRNQKSFEKMNGKKFSNQKQHGKVNRNGKGFPKGRQQQHAKRGGGSGSSKSHRNQNFSKRRVKPYPS
jgi:hypothetical protein